MGRRGDLGRNGIDLYGPTPIVGPQARTEAADELPGALFAPDFEVFDARLAPFIDLGGLQVVVEQPQGIAAGRQQVGAEQRVGGLFENRPPGLQNGQAAEYGVPYPTSPSPP